MPTATDSAVADRAPREPVAIAAADVQAFRTRVVWSDRVRLERILRSWSQHDLARVAGVTQPQVSRIERGRQGTSRTVLVKIAKAFGERAGDLFPYDDALDDDAPDPVPRVG